MNSKLRASALQINFIIFVCFSILSLVVGSRDFSVGTDTENYIIFYESMVGSYLSVRFEPGYEMLSWLAATFGLSTSSYLFVLSFIQFILLFLVSRYAAKVFCCENDQQKFVLLLLSFFVASPFFMNGQINIIRQGFSAIIIIYAALMFVERNYFLYFFWSMLAVAFHYSAIMYVLLIPLLVFGFYPAIFLSLVVSAAYIFGYSEYAVRLFSEITGWSVYDYVRDYEEGAEYRGGVRIDFVVFSLVVPLLLYGFVRFFSLENLHKLIKCLSIYFIFVIPFWIFGWGNYSDRYAYNGWLFMAVFFATAILPFLRNLKLEFFIVFFVVAINIFLWNFFYLRGG